MKYEKKYNEALKRAKAYHRNELAGSRKEMMEYIFPELRESEDERIRKEIIDFLETIPASELKRIPRPISEWFAWLEKQSEYHIPWYDYQKSKEAGYTIVPNEEYEQLIKQKEQKPASISCGHENDTELSEEDERRIDAICELLENTSAIHPNYSRRKLIIWLKSLRPCPSWKPSEEQMEALQCAIAFMEIRKASDYDISPLKSLYEQLKKL